jgi:hypothetical protein
MESLFTQKELIQIGVALIAGGAMGSILKALFDIYQRRIQTIIYEMHVQTKSRIDDEQTRLETFFNIPGEDESRRFERYYVVAIVLRNTTNTHFDNFNFGVTLSGEDVAFKVDAISPDRHHSLLSYPLVNLNSANNRIDFVCKPFNRRDRYLLKFYISVAPSKDGIGNVRLSSSLPVKFVDAQVRSNFARTLGVSEAKRLVLQEALRQTDEVVIQTDEKGKRFLSY